MKFNRPKAPSKFLRTDDLPNGKALVTIRGFSNENMAGENKPPQIKPVIWFNEFQKGMAFNQTNEVLMCGALNLNPKDWDTDHVIGKKIVIFNDPSVQMNNEFVGGLRIRAANIRPAAPVAAQAPAPSIGWPAASPSPPRNAPGLDDGFQDSPLDDEF